MVSRTPRRAWKSAVRDGAVLLAGLLVSGALTGCLLIGGSSRGGFFIFPGSLGLIFLIVVIALVLRRR